MNEISPFDKNKSFNYLFYQEVECLTVDGPLVVSSCLGGQIRVWDSTSGECLTVIQRKGYDYV